MTDNTLAQQILMKYDKFVDRPTINCIQFHFYELKDKLKCLEYMPKSKDFYYDKIYINDLFHFSGKVAEALQFIKTNSSKSKMRIVVYVDEEFPWQKMNTIGKGSVKFQLLDGLWCGDILKSNGDTTIIFAETYGRKRIRLDLNKESAFS